MNTLIVDRWVGGPLQYIHSLRGQDTNIAWSLHVLLNKKWVNNKDKVKQQMKWLVLS